MRDFNRRKSRSLLVWGLAAALLSPGCATTRNPKIAEEPKAVLTLGGDVNLFHWPIRDVYQEIGKGRSREVVYDYPFEKVKPFLKGVVFANLEGPLTEWGPIKFDDKDEKSYFAVPTEYVQGLVRSGFRGMFLANNHLRDCSDKGVKESLQTMLKAGLISVGAGANDREARQPGFTTENGIKIGFLAYDLVPPKSVWAGPKRPGAAHASLKEIIADVKAAKAQCDQLVVNFHWGKEYRRERELRPPDKFRVKVARAVIDAGASLVVGEHSHMVERMEAYGQGLIFYGLGNFVFGAATREGHPKSMIIQVDLTKKGVAGYRVIPLLISPRKTRYQPLPLEGEEKEKFLDWFSGL